MTPEALKLRADNNLAQLPPQERKRVSWILSAGADDMQRQLKSMTGTAADRRVLEVAFDLENAGAQRTTRIKAVTAALKRFTGAVAAPVGPPPAAILKAAQADLEKHSAAIKRHIESFDKLTLANKLGLGLAALKAHMVFAVVDPAQRNKGGKNQHAKGGQLTREEASGGFAGWLTSINADLKEPLAYKYMTAVRGLGLDHTAADRQIAAELKRREKAGETVTLASLMAAATERIAPPAELPAPPVQLTLDDYLATLKSFREDADTVIQQAKDMPPELRKAACARAYATLSALTGTPWQPADEHDELGTVNPDEITL